VRSPRFGEYLQRYAEIRSLQKELDGGERELTGQNGRVRAQAAPVSAGSYETAF